MKYKIDAIYCLGFSHCGEEDAFGSGAVDLTDEETNTLVALVKEKQTRDVEELNIENTHPDLYKKLEKAYYNMKFKVWVEIGIDSGGIVPSEDETLMEWCKQNCGFAYDPNKRAAAEDDFDEEELEETDKECFQFDEWFSEWLSGYIKTLDNDQAFDFFCDHLSSHVDLSLSDVKVKIPGEILEMAGRGDLAEEDMMEVEDY